MADIDRQWDGNDPAWVLCSLLADERCRRVIEYLESMDTAVTTVEELAEWAATTDELSGTRKQMAVRLHHVLLPKLADFGVVEYDPQQRAVRYAGHCGLERVLARIRSEENSG